MVACEWHGEEEHLKQKYHSPGGHSRHVKSEVLESCSFSETFPAGQHEHFKTSFIN